jgi:hypothetical protein
MNNRWYKDIVLGEDISKVFDCLEWFESELDDARQEIKVSGSLEKAASRLPGIFEHRYSQLQELEAILEYLNIETRKCRSKHYKAFKEAYNTELSDKIIEKYINGVDEVIDWEKLCIAIGLVHSQMTGITKALDQKNWQLGHIVKLRAAGLEDVQI